MQLSTKQAAEFCGTTERALRYYDRIGLVCPRRMENNYRIYTEQELLRLQEVLFYRSLGLPIQKIAALLDAPDYDRMETLARHRALLLLEREQIDRTVAWLDTALQNRIGEEQTMKQTKKYRELHDRYREEAEQRWGKTQEYQCSEQREAARSEEQNDAVMQQAAEIFAAFAAQAAAGASPKAAAAQALCEQWQAHITAHHYPCTKQILKGLAKMYIADARFQQNLDAYGSGTAQFMHDALVCYCED